MSDADLPVPFLIPRGEAAPGVYVAGTQDLSTLVLTIPEDQDGLRGLLIVAGTSAENLSDATVIRILRYLNLDEAVEMGGDTAIMVKAWMARHGMRTLREFRSLRLADGSPLPPEVFAELLPVMTQGRPHCMVRVSSGPVEPAAPGSEGAEGSSSAKASL